jgi:formylglycine-generating enzyme required for sulfatase activity
MPYLIHNFLNAFSNHFIIVAVSVCIISSLNSQITDVGKAPPGMVWIAGGEFTMGTNTDPQRRSDESPAHPIKLDGFWMDITEVTNAQFAEFVKATGYITTAEQAIDWEKLKKQLPEGTQKPSDKQLQPVSMVFNQPLEPVELTNYFNWWSWVPGADWKHPQGPQSNIRGKENYPVVQVSWDDAAAYCIWAGKRLPTEAEWEFAARSNLQNAIYPWGSDTNPVSYANTWQGHFPDKNSAEDKYLNTSPAKSYPANEFGLYDMAGNVWEWCADWYDSNYYKECLKTGVISNPAGPASPHDSNQSYSLVRVKRGGSFLCNEDYCNSYRTTARMATSYDTSQDHSGFRCVMTQQMWEDRNK